MKWVIRLQWFVIVALCMTLTYLILKWVFFAVISMFLVYLAVRIMLASRRKARH